MSLNPRETLDTMLGLLGFVCEIKEIPAEHGLTLQVYTADKERLIGRNGALLDDIQLLLNRVIQARDKTAPRVQVDIEHWREMKERPRPSRPADRRDRAENGSRLSARTDERLRAPDRSQRLQGRPRNRDIEPARRRPDQTHHPAQAPPRRPGLTRTCIPRPRTAHFPMRSRPRRGKRSHQNTGENFRRIEGLSLPPFGGHPGRGGDTNSSK